MSRPICHACGAAQLTAQEQDGRNAHWRIRIRLYDQKNPDEPQFDTDPDEPADRAGSEVVAGLRGMTAALVELAQAAHGGPLYGLDLEKLDKRLAGLRPTLSRRRGNAVFRVTYDTAHTFDPAGTRAAQWVARVDIQRENAPVTEPVAPAVPSPLRRRAP